MDPLRRSLLGAGAGSGLGLLAGLPSAMAAGGAQGPALDARKLGLRPDAPGDQTAALQAAVDRAAADGAPLFLPAGRYETGNLRISRPAAVIGVPGLTRLVFTGGPALLSVAQTGSVTLSGLTFDGAGRAFDDTDDGALLVARGVDGLTVEACTVTASTGSGMDLGNCSGRIAGNTISSVARTGLFALDSRGLEVAGNRLGDIGNNGIQIWRSAAGEDGTLVTGNRIEAVRADAGGSGQNGNGINIFRANGVTVADNHVADCAFSAVRGNAASSLRIADNQCRRLGEVALYAEFAFEGAVISGNIVEDAAIGISMTNFNEGGRLAVCSGNLVRGLKVLPDAPDERGIGIAAEADTAISGNVVEDAPRTGIMLGWGRYMRDVNATGNIVRNARWGIAASVSKGAGRALVTGNTVSGTGEYAIVGHDHGRAATGELADGSTPAPANLLVANNQA